MVDYSRSPAQRTGSMGKPPRATSTARSKRRCHSLPVGSRSRLISRRYPLNRVPRLTEHAATKTLGTPLDADTGYTTHR